MHRGLRRSIRLGHRRSIRIYRGFRCMTSTTPTATGGCPALILEDAPLTAVVRLRSGERWVSVCKAAGSRHRSRQSTEPGGPMLAGSVAQLSYRKDRSNRRERA